MMTATPNRQVTLGQLLPALSFSECAATPVGELQLDSRQVQPGDSFLAVGGTLTHGEKFILDALSRGARVIFENGDDYHAATDAQQMLRVRVPQLGERISELAGRYYGEPSQDMTVTAITGTNGKTTTTQWLAQLLQLLGTPAASVGTLGYGRVGDEVVATGLTTPDAVSLQRILRQMLDEGTAAVVMEASSHSLDQRRLAGVNVDVAVFTNIGRDHLDYHGDMKSYVAAKLKLMDFPSLQAAVVNIDDPVAAEFIARAAGHCRVLTCSLRGNADFAASQVRYHAGGIEAELTTPEGQFDLQLAIWGEFNLSNLLVVIAAAYAQGFSVASILTVLPQLHPVAGRLQAVEVDSDINVLVDFAHTADALESVLQALRAHTRQKIWCVFGCGGDRDKGKRPLMAQVAENLADRVVITSDNPRTEEPQMIIDDILQGVSDRSGVLVEADREQAIRLAVTQAEAGDCVLIAGKGHEDYQQIGTEKLPFSDLAVAEKILLERRAGGVQ